ncbi:hypothetical protein FRX31_007675 [Thalictrum thalictroides]|uniref:Reverse transcriptase zinc-binding domain n=1 Tax=Thalictrum thalictroides TaxID=46969 RepID=A0A7J6X107_THATH|nr:hypothetical protein FRX31_007675 [Thalictrum thalictroides]
MKNIKYLITNGQDIDIWEDPWSNLGPLKLNPQVVSTWGSTIPWGATLDTIITSRSGNAHLISLLPVVEAEVLLKYLFSRTYHINMCNTEEESIQYLFLRCCFVKEIWEGFMRGIAAHELRTEVAHVREWIEKWPRCDATIWGAELWELTPYAMIWCAWKMRNEAIFKEKQANVEKARVQILATLWNWTLTSQASNGHGFQELVRDWNFVVTGDLE